MALKTKTQRERLEEIRKENKDNPNYPKLTLKGDILEVQINGKTYEGSKEDMKEKFKATPYFLEEYNEVVLLASDFISYNMDWIDKELSKG